MYKYNMYSLTIYSYNTLNNNVYPISTRYINIQYEFIEFNL